MRADRLVSILLLLQVYRRLTARTLALRLGVSERTIQRDMGALCTAGIPLYAERGAGGGWILPEQYRTNLTGLSEPEIQALFVAKPSRILADLGLEQAAEALLVKLLAALPAAHRRDAEYARQRIQVDATGWNRADEAVPFLPILQEAIWRERVVCLTYRRGDGEVERLVDPLGLVAKGSVWYLVAAMEGEVRTYRVSRVQNARMTEQPCIRPPNFDLAAHWAQASDHFQAGLPRYPFVVRVSPSTLPSVRRGGHYVRVERAEPPGDDGWSTVVLLGETEDEVCEFVLGFGPRMAVVEPPALRERVRAAAEATAALYAAADTLPFHER